jgi:hypothetical protein
MTDIEEKQDINENELNDIEDEISLLKPKRKMRKFPRTEKQQEAFKKTMEKRALNVEKRKQQRRIDAAKLLLEVENREQETPKEDKVRARKQNYGCYHRIR